MKTRTPSQAGNLLSALHGMKARHITPVLEPIQAERSLHGQVSERAPVREVMNTAGCEGPLGEQICCVVDLSYT